MASEPLEKGLRGILKVYFNICSTFWQYNLQSEVLSKDIVVIMVKCVVEDEHSFLILE
jgi:hypothetical protein